jgi:3-oxocholest-4-en-26-oyl-CoA dehydrogenase alpha subunit
VRVAYTPEQIALRDEVRAYFERLLTPELRAELGPRPGETCGPVYRRIVKQLGADGWLGIGWPKAYGGQGRSPIDQYIFFDEARRIDAPVPLVTLNTVGPTLMEFGSEEQKDRFLPSILRGDVHFSIGYTEPGAGTDLASLRTRAVADGEDYVINGQKIFTTGAHDADFIWLAARTDADAPKHKGISIFIVDTLLDGFKVTPIETMDDGRTNACYFADVRVPASMLVGARNDGWRLITTQLNNERVALSVGGRLEKALEDVLAYARGARAAGGGALIDEPWVRMTLAWVRARVDGLKLLNWNMVCEMSEGRLSPADASACKVYSSELFVEGYRKLLEVLGHAGTLKEGSPGAVLAGWLELQYRWAYVLTFGGGVNEVQREIIAVAGLGLPRAKR